MKKPITDEVMKAMERDKDKNLQNASGKTIGEVVAILREDGMELRYHALSIVVQKSIYDRFRETLKERTELDIEAAYNGAKQAMADTYDDIVKERATGRMMDEFYADAMIVAAIDEMRGVKQ